MTDSEIDSILERFDQTEPHLQRQIVALLVEKLAVAEDAKADLLAACKAILASPCRGDEPSPEAVDMARAAIAKAEGKRGSR